MTSNKDFAQSYEQMHWSHVCRQWEANKERLNKYIEWHRESNNELLKSRIELFIERLKEDQEKLRKRYPKHFL